MGDPGEFKTINPAVQLARIEAYADRASAIDGLRPHPAGPSDPLPPLPGWATAPEVVELEGVTLVRPDDAAIRDEYVRPGLRYRDLVRDHGRCRVVLDLAGIRPFGHPFHDDLFAILRELGRGGGRLALCGGEAWFIDRLPMYRR